jgi:DNA-binding MarR family transcriptional regulator
MLLAEIDPQAAPDLARKLGISQTRVVRALNRLCDRDLLRYRRNPLDHNAIIAHPTARGRALLRELCQDFSEAIEGLEIRILMPAAA